MSLLFFFRRYVGVDLFCYSLFRFVSCVRLGVGKIRFKSTFKKYGTEQSAVRCLFDFDGGDRVRSGVFLGLAGRNKRFAHLRFDRVFTLCGYAYAVALGFGFGERDFVRI